MAPGDTGRPAGLLGTSRVGEDADRSGAISAPRPARITRHPPLRQIASSLGGALRTKLQRGAVLSDGESWGAGRVMVFQHPSASFGFQDGIQVRMPSYQVQWHQSSLEPAPARPIDPRLASRQRRAPPAPAPRASGRWLSHLPNQVFLLCRIHAAVRRSIALLCSKSFMPDCRSSTSSSSSAAGSSG